MSQRTRAPMTGAATRKLASAAADTDAPPPRSTKGGARSRRGTQSAPASPDPALPPLDPGAIARVLRVMADEVERDPVLARRVADATAATQASSDEADAPVKRGNGRAAGGGTSGVGKAPFKARIVIGAGPELGVGVPDPIALRARLGRDGLRAALDELRLGTLRAMVREYQLDGPGRTPQHNDAARLRQLILAATDVG